MRRSGPRLRFADVAAHVWLLTLMSWWVMGCGNSPAGRRPVCQARQVRATPLRIAAASDLQLALPSWRDDFRPGPASRSTPTFGASGQLAEQIKQGAPFDVFLAANEAFVRDLADGGFDPARVGSCLCADRWSWRSTASWGITSDRWPT